MLYLCMTEFKVGKNVFICHGKAIPKDIAERAPRYSCTSRTNNCRMVSWVERADIPHRCNVDSCILHRVYLTDRIWKIGLKLVFYEECKRFLKTKFPTDIVQYILKKCFDRKQIKINS